jgi:hypothetical protein
MRAIRKEHAHQEYARFEEGSVRMKIAPNDTDANAFHLVQAS